MRYMWVLQNSGNYHYLEVLEGTLYGHLGYGLRMK